MRRKLTIALLILLSAFPAPAAWDPTKPATSSALVSADFRNNWTAIGQSVATENLLADNTFRVWAAGDSAAPSYWRLVGAGATIARTGTGLGDTTRKWGPYTAKLTAGGGAVGFLFQAIQPATAGSSVYDDGNNSREVSAGVWVLCNTTSANLNIVDGVGTSSSGSPTINTWTWLTAARTLDAAATKLEISVSVAASQRCYVSGPTFVLGPVVPRIPQPSRWQPVTFECFLSGNQSTGTDKAGCSWDPNRPGFILDVQLRAKTGPTTQALIVDVNTWDGAAFTSMFSTRPQIAAGATRGGAPPDSTYSRRCFTGQFGSTLATGGEISVDVDQIGSGTVGADLKVQVRALVAARPLEAFIAYNDIN